MTDFDTIKALAFDHYGTLFDKHAVAKVIEDHFSGQGDEWARLWFLRVLVPNPKLATRNSKPS